MTKIKNMLKKGFTLTELAIVIAVIAILIAVLVPTFISLINSANESKDTQMIYNVNQALTIENSNINTVEDALDIAAEAGYNIDKLTPSSDGEIVYDHATKSFALISTEGEVIYPTSNSNLDLYAPTTYYFVDEATYTSLNSAEASASSYSLAKTTVKSLTSEGSDNTKVHTVSYVAIGEWTDAFSYTGMGAINTTRATGITSISYTSQKATSNDKYKSDYDELMNVSYYINNDTTVLTIEITESGIYTIYSSVSSGVTLNLNVASGVECTFTVIEENADAADIAYDKSNANINFSSIKKGGVEVSVDNATYDSSILEGVTYTDNGTIQLGTISYTYTGDTETKTIEIDQVTDTNGSIILQLGTEKYPYLISDFSTYAEIAYARCGAEEGDIYFKLQNNVYITERVRMVSNFYNSDNVAEDLACNIHFDLSSYNVYFVSNENCNKNFIYDDQSTGSYIISNGSFYAVDINYTSLDSGMQCFIFNRCSAEFTNCNFDMVAFDFTLQDSDITILFDTCNITYKQTENTEDTALMTINDNRFNDEKASIIFNNVNIKVASYYSIVLYTYDEETLLMSFTNVTFNNTIVEKIYDMSEENEIYASLIYTDSYSADYFGQDICQNCTFTVGNIAVDIYGNTIEN